MTTELAPAQLNNSHSPLPFQALHNFVLIEPIEPKTGKVQLPDGVRISDELKRGIIRSIGDGHHTENGTWIPTNLKRGQTVYTSFPDKYEIAAVQIGGKRYLLVHEGDIAGIVPEQEPAA